MRIDGFRPQSSAIKRTPRQAPSRAQDDDQEIEDAVLVEQPRTRPGGLPARTADIRFPRAHDRRTALALASYLSTATLLDWDDDVLGLDLYI